MKTGEMGPGHQFGRAPLRSRERGYVLFAVAFSIIAIVGFAGLVIDVGMMQTYKRRAQTAADAGALGGALELFTYGSTNLALAVTHDVTANGFTTGVNGVTVVKNNPPASGQYAGKATYVEVIVSKQVPMTFMQALGFSAATVAARAVGGPGKSSTCVYVLNPTSSDALKVSGSAILDSNCGVMVNSNNAKAINISGSACVTAPKISAKGGYVDTSSCGSNVTPTTGVATVLDPFASLAPPAVGACTSTAYASAASVVINPGVYCNGITVNGGTLTMNPGVYILSGGGLTLKAGAGIAGSGVTIYNTTANGYAYKPITSAGNTAINLTAPTSGAFESILIYTDRTITNTTANTITGNNTSIITGTIYMPGVPLSFTGNSTLIAYTVLAVNKLTLTGNASINDDYSSLANGAPVRSGAVVAE
jgi:hypothetical protein